MVLQSWRRPPTAEAGDACARAVLDQQQTHWECITLREEFRIEEAPEACKAIGPVIEAQEEEGFISAVARLRPWVTFKA